MKTKMFSIARAGGSDQNSKFMVIPGVTKNVIKVRRYNNLLIGSSIDLHLGNWQLNIYYLSRKSSYCILNASLQSNINVKDQTSCSPLSSFFSTLKELSINTSDQRFQKIAL
jgi:hypothetical protein